MKTLPLFALLLGCCLPLAAAPSAPAPGRTKPQVDLFVSAGDSWWFSSWLPVDSAASIHDSVTMLADVLDLRRIYWRGEQCDLLLDYDLIRPENLLYHSFYADWVRHLVQDLRLNQALVEEAHRRKIEVYLWAPLFDYGGPADNGGCREYPYYAQSKLTLAHPDWMPVDRFGVRRQGGVIEFAYPEARKAVIDIWLHYIDRDHLDGITFFTYCENYGLRFEDEFGYSQPIVDEYKRRYGVDIRTQEFDKVLWRSLRGEYITDFLRELKTALHARGKKLGVRLNSREPNYPDRWNVPLYFLTAGRIYMDWERWVREGLVDELSINGSAPGAIQNRTIENVLQATNGTSVSVSALTTQPNSPRLQPYVARGLRLLLFGTDDTSYLKLSYAPQTKAALTGSDVYATVRFLGQVGDGQATATVGDLLPLAHHPNILVRRQVMRALGQIGDAAGLPALAAGLHDPERSVRSAAVFACAHLHGPDTAQELIAAVRELREFSLVESASSTLVAIGGGYLPELLALTRDSDVLLRRMGVYVLSRRSDASARPALIAALSDPDLEIRFKAAAGLQLAAGDPAAAAALAKALDDSSEVVQNRAALSLAVALLPGATLKPRLGLESAVGILATKTGPLAERPLTPLQQQGLEALVRQFHKFGDASVRTDLDWGFRPTGNALLAFGAEGGRRLQGLIDQGHDHRLAVLAWQVLNIRQGMENFCLVPDSDQVDAEIYASYPGRTFSTETAPSPVKYDPTNKDN